MWVQCAYHSETAALMVTEQPLPPFDQGSFPLATGSSSLPGQSGASGFGSGGQDGGRSGLISVFPVQSAAPYRVQALYSPRMKSCLHNSLWSDDRGGRDVDGWIRETSVHE